MPEIRWWMIVRRDQLCGLMLRAIIALWLIWLGFLMVGAVGGEGTQLIVTYGAPRLFIASGATTGALVPILLWRLWMMKRVFRIGVQTQAVVTEVIERQGIHRVWYRYQWNDTTIMGRNLVKQDRRFTSVSNGDIIEIVLLPNRPDRSFALPLFQSSPR